MKLLPGQHEGESDIQDCPQPGEKWQLGAWLDDAGSMPAAATSRRRLYLYDLTTSTISCTFRRGRY